MPTLYKAVLELESAQKKCPSSEGLWQALRRVPEPRKSQRCTEQCLLREMLNNKITQEQWYFKSFLLLNIQK